MRSHWRLAAAAMVVSGLGVSIATPAHAQGRAGGALLTEKDRKDAARKEYKAAEAQFKLGHYQPAYERYKAADDYFPLAATKYKMAMCLDKLGKIIDAARMYQTFLDMSPSPDKFADAILDAKTRLDALRRTPGRIRLSIDPPGVGRLGLSVDGGPLTAPPYDKTLTTAPGHHRISATAPGYDPAYADIDIGFAENRDLRLVLNRSVPGAPPPLPPPPPSQPVAVVGPQPPVPMPLPPPSQGRPSHIPSYVLFGVAGAGAVVGGIFGGLALSAKSDFNKAARPTLAMANKEQNLARVSDIALFSALGVAAVGAVLLFVPLPTSSTAENAAATKTAGARGFVAPYAGPTGGGATAVLTF